MTSIAELARKLDRTRDPAARRRLEGRIAALKAKRAQDQPAISASTHPAKAMARHASQTDHSLSAPVAHPGTSAALPQISLEEAMRRFLEQVETGEAFAEFDPYDHAHQFNGVTLDEHGRQVCSKCGKPKIDRVKFFVGNKWSRALLSMVAKKHGLTPFRKSREKNSTLWLEGPEEEIYKAWDDFLEIDGELMDGFGDMLSAFAREKNLSPG